MNLAAVSIDSDFLVAVLVILLIVCCVVWLAKR